MSVRSLLNAVNRAENADHFWAVQQQLSQALAREETFITKRRRQTRRLICEKKSYARSEFRSVERIRRFDDSISTCRSYEQRRSLRRSTVLYLGDTLAFRLLPEHYINVLCQNDRPGFFAGKRGRQLEVQAGDFVASQGEHALLHDLTHCLRIGDLSFVKDGFAPVVAEFGSARRHSSKHAHRKARQHERLKLVGKVLNESVERTDAEALRRYSLPSGFVEQDRQFTYHVRAFEEASRIGPKGYTIVQPEQGLVYIATEPGCPPTEFMPEFMSTIRPCRFDFTHLRARVEGQCPWVPPITLQPIDDDVLVRYLDLEFNFYVYLDMDQLVRRLAQSSSRLRPLLDVPERLNELGGWFVFEADWGNDGRVYIGPKVLHRVLFGLATLESAVKALAEAGNVARDFEPEAALYSDTSGI